MKTIEVVSGSLSVENISDLDIVRLVQPTSMRLIRVVK